MDGTQWNPSPGPDLAPRCRKQKYSLKRRTLSRATMLARDLPGSSRSSQAPNFKGRLEREEWKGR
jgi:hypothetical protein